MKPRTIILIGIAIIFIVCAGVYFYFVIMNGKIPTPVDNGTSTVGGNEVTLPAAQAFPSAPTGTILIIGTQNGSVQVNNFYLSNPQVTDGGQTVILASTTDYLITYDTTDSSFWIGINADEFNAIRPVAEQALLSTLNVSSTIACKLNVSVGVFYSATSTLSGKSFPLSFCGNLNSGQ